MTIYYILIIGMAVKKLHVWEQTTAMIQLIKGAGNAQL